MNIDLENAICYDQEQRRKRYKKNNENARARTNLAQQTENSLHLPKCQLTEEFCHYSQLHDLQQQVQLIANEENDYNDNGLHDDYNAIVNKDNCIISSAEDHVINFEYNASNNDFYIDNVSNYSICYEDDNESIIEEVCLHEYTDVSSKSYCTDLLHLLRDGDISKSHSTRLITLIKSILPIPNHLPSTMDDLLSFMNVDNLFSRRSICLISDIYDVNLKDVLTTLVKRLSPIIEEYKQQINNDFDEQGTKDIPYRHLYKELLKKHSSENIISFILHLDGVSLTRSTRLKMWLFSASFVELPSTIRYHRYNMMLMSIWVAYAEPEPEPRIWLKSIISQIQSVKLQDIVINEKLNYKLKIYAITGDCPALKLILDFIGHGGYFCCWFCYIRGEHIAGKRQYKFELPMIIRDPAAYEEESYLAQDKQMNVYGHLGVSILTSILDIPLPDAVIIDYLHVTLLGHAKSLISNIFYSLKPIERLEVDSRLTKQNFPHYFNRKMKAISNFGFVKATELKNMLFYGVLPIFHLYLSIEKLSHLALFVCFTRLLHGPSIVGLETSKLADELFQQFYRDHDEHYYGLQNLVLHLHTHFATMYQNHGALSNIGCFGQEDLIGSVGSNHHGTRYYGESIAYYYNIDFSLHNKSTRTTTVNEAFDPLNESIDQYDNFHAELCDCGQLYKCFNIYRRFVIKQQMFHSLIYKKRVSHDGPEKYRVVGRTSVQKMFNDKAVVSNIAGEVQIITSGTMDYCRKQLKQKVQELEGEGGNNEIDEEGDDDDDDVRSDDNDDNEINDNNNGDDTLHVNQSSTSRLKRPSYGFSTPALKRSYNNGNLSSRSNQRCNRDRSLQNDDRSRSKITVSRDRDVNKNVHHHYQEKITDNASRITCSTQDNNCCSDTNIESMFKDEMTSGMRSLKKEVSKLRKQVDYLTIPSLSKNDQLSSYRDESDKENYPDVVSWNGKNLLKVAGRDVGDYGRKLMGILFTEEELRSSILPSQAAHMYQKKLLDEERFRILNNAIRIKYRLSEDGYRRYYNNTLRVKLSRFLYDQGSRKLKQKVVLHGQQQQSPQQPRAITVSSTPTTELSFTATQDIHNSYTHG
ncbi:unnamed protein product [Rotaria sordida]|uniref:Uncharacterized protein n=1 Tax=Rotaria sordida TaxID=392033 RepID=A0A815NL43_9BILA|nr:unnamed protein product [Rotaria sordida]CAF1633755.1 unnamed protein product [Rotaria sordida]